MDILVSLIIAGIIQGLGLGILLILSGRGNARANRILGLLIVFFSISISHTVIYSLGLYRVLPHLILIQPPLTFLFGPLFLFYERTLIFGNYRVSKKEYNHLIPFILSIVILSPFYLKNGEEKILFLTSAASIRVGELTTYLQAIQVIQLFIYLFIIYKDLEIYKKRLLNVCSSIEKISLDWLKYFVMLFILVYIVIVILLLIYLLGLGRFVNSFGAQIIGISVTISVYVIGYKGLLQPEIFTFIEFKEMERNHSQRNEKRLFEERDKNRLIEYMIEKKPYLNDNLTLIELAEELRMHRNQLSILINSGFGENFYEFINRYRVEEAKLLLNNPTKEHYTILAIAFESGFNSKSTFYNIFKKNTGVTPVEYRLRYENKKEGEK